MSDCVCNTDTNPLKVYMHFELCWPLRMNSLICYRHPTHSMFATIATLAIHQAAAYICMLATADINRDYEIGCEALIFKLM